MKFKVLVSTLVLAAVTVTAASIARANTTVAGGACQAYQGSNESFVIHSFLGCVTLGTTSTVSVVFPEVRINQPTAQSLYVDTTGSTTASLLCNAYLYPYNGGPSTWSDTRTVTCNAFNEMSFSVPADAWGYLTVYCNLPPNCRIMGTGLSPG